MAETLDFDARMSSEGRVVVPAAVRAALGARPGDRLRFMVRDGEVILVSAQSLLDAVWANNHGGDAGDSVSDVRRERQVDTDVVEARWERLAAEAADGRSEEDIETSLSAQLGLSR